jgi:hypothetical protein
MAPVFAWRETPGVGQTQRRPPIAAASSNGPLAAEMNPRDETVAPTKYEPSRGPNSLRRTLLLRVDQVPEQKPIDRRSDERCCPASR